MSITPMPPAKAKGTRAGCLGQLSVEINIPENAVLRGRTRERTNRSRLVFVDCSARLATALARNSHGQFSRWLRDRRPNSGRLDRSVAADPLEDEPNAARRTDSADGVGGVRRFRFRKDGGNSRTGRRYREVSRDGAETKGLYRQLCKRPCFHDEYLQAFNRPGVRLIDTDGKGVGRITEKGVVVASVEYAVDCIIYASGFEFGAEYTRRAGSTQRVVAA